MRRFAWTSVTLVAGLVLAPACGSLLGIDTDRDVVDSVDASSSTSSSTSSSSSSSSGDVEGGATTCNPTACSGVARDAKNASCVDGVCHLACKGAECKREITCPAGHDCVIDCEGGESCKDNTSCTGGNSCTLECTKGSCADARCDSPTCTFLCSGTNCFDDEKRVRCASSTTSCTVECRGPGPACFCCDGGDDDDDNVTCPQRAMCPGGG